MVPTWLDVGTYFGAKWGQTKPENNHLLIDCLIDFGPLWPPKTTTVFIAETPPVLHQSRSPARSGRFWPHLGPLVPVLAPFWRFRDPLLAPSRPSCTEFGRILAVLGPLVGDSGDMFDAVLGSCASFSDCVFGPTLGPEAETRTNSTRHKPRARHGGGHCGGSRTWIYKRNHFGR